MDNLKINIPFFTWLEINFEMINLDPPYLFKSPYINVGSSNLYKWDTKVHGPIQYVPTIRTYYN